MSSAKRQPRGASKRLAEAISVLKQLGFRGRQCNEASAYALVALLDLGPTQSWQEASAPLRGITPIIEFISEVYRVRYAPNTRETLRDESVKYFCESGLLVRNPDNPARPTNSGKTVYQIERHALDLMRSHGTVDWSLNVTAYLNDRKGIRSELERHREIARIPVNIPSGKSVTLSPGGQNPLIKAVIEEFCSRFTPGAEVVYVGDAEGKFGIFEQERLRELGIKIHAPSKMPDVVVYFRSKNWLVLIEAVTSAGPVDGKRRVELKRLFDGSSAGLIFVTAFETRTTMRSFLAQISWESEVWIADDPSHLIHFDGERFLGPYPDVTPDVQ